MGRSHEVGNEECLILLEYHAVSNDLLFVQIVPGTVCALFTVTTIFQDPLAVLVLDSGLHLWDELVVYADVAIGWATDDELLLLILAHTDNLMK